MRRCVVRIMTILTDTITETEAPTFRADIHIAGSRAAATDACREFCLRGLCVTVAEDNFVYTGGMEAGVRIGLINYPRFPKAPEEIFQVASELARFLIGRLRQQSCCVVGDDKTVWLSRRSWT